MTSSRIFAYSMAMALPLLGCVRESNTRDMAQSPIDARSMVYTDTLGNIVTKGPDEAVGRNLTEGRFPKWSPVENKFSFFRSSLDLSEEWIVILDPVSGILSKL